VYEHTQYAGVMILVPVVAAILFAAYFGIVYSNSVSLVTAGILAVVLFLFHKLTVAVDAEFVRVAFGPGIIRMRFRLSDIESCQVVRNPWYAGWGLRILPRGYLLNVSGLEAVELRTKGGSIHRIGTDEPEVLCRVIESRLGMS